jgi:hypothetical protein
MTYSTFLFFAILGWSIGYVDNMLRVTDDRLLNVPIWAHVLCGFPRFKNSDKALTYEGLYMQMAGCFLFACGLLNYRIDISLFGAVIISSLSSLIITKYLENA